MGVVVPAGIDRRAKKRADHTPENRRRDGVCSFLSKRSPLFHACGGSRIVWGAAYSRLPVSSMAAVRAVRGAVSHRRMRGPKPTVTAPAALAASASTEKPPSLPVTMAIFLAQPGRSTVTARERRRPHRKTAPGRNLPARHRRRRRSSAAAWTHGAAWRGPPAWRPRRRYGCSVRFGILFSAKLRSNS